MWLRNCSCGPTTRGKNARKRASGKAATVLGCLSAALAGGLALHPVLPGIDMRLSMREQESGMDAESRGGGFFPAVVAFSVALATLLLQLVQTRIFGVVFWNHLVYFIISIALLGFGISGTWMSFGRNSRFARFMTLQNAALGFVITTVISSLLVPCFGVGITSFFAGMPKFFVLFFTYAVAVLPYFCGGWMLGAVFRDNVRGIHFLYFADLVGAGLGCLLFLAAMRPLGAINLVLLACALVAVPVLLQGIRARRNQVWLVLLVILLAGLASVQAVINTGINPEPTKAFNALYTQLPANDRKVVEFSEWNPISRIDVVSSTGTPKGKRVFIDGDAWTGMVTNVKFPVTPFPPDDGSLATFNSPYFLYRNPPNVLVIGSGGGVDIVSALRGGARNVDAIEINPTTWRLLLEDYKDKTNALMFQPGVSAFNEEGRSFVRRTGKNYDLIVLHGIDTFAALSTGAYVLSENYLYTVDAMQDYLGHLAEGGALCITRWVHHAETPRLFIVCMEALSRLGVENPAANILYHGRGAQGGTILVRRTPFSGAETSAFSSHITSRGSVMFHPVDEGERTLLEQRLIGGYLRSRDAGTKKAFFASLPYDISPVFDDSPFFFHFDKPRNLLNVMRDESVGDLVRGHWPSFTLFSLLAFTLIAVTVFMLIPLMFRGGWEVVHFKSWLLYFSCLGVSFIFVEISLMQRFALLLGHPSRALALVLAALLISAGIGSQMRSVLRLNLGVCLALLSSLILVSAFVYPHIVNAVLGQSLAVRGAVTVLLVAPLGFLMGMPFPSGLRRVSDASLDAVPWMWAVNGGTTVLGSILAIILAIWCNFTTVLVLAAAGYAVALAVTLRLPRAERP